MKHIVSIWVILAAVAMSADTPTARETYGNASVGRIVQVAPDGALICDLEGFPAIIGKNIPVYLADVDIAPNNQVSQSVIAFIRQAVKPDAEGNCPAIELSDIRRGQTFSLVANIAIEGKDLTEMLIEKGLAQRIIVLDPAQETPSASPSSTVNTPKQNTTRDVGVVASKSSKVFHRPDCPHAKRMDMTKAVTYRTRQEAEQNGRRPCKTCNP